MREFDFTEETDLDGNKLFEGGKFRFEPGLTMLTGCNGSGKTTLLKTLKRELGRLGIPETEYMALDAPGRIQTELAASPHAAAGMWYRSRYASEGEKTANNLASLVSRIGTFVLSEHAGDEEVWVLFDSLDSATSIDAQREFRKFFDTMVETRPAGMDLYVVCAANSFEFARGADCIDVTSSKHMRFASYEEYAGYVVDTRRQKDRRLG